IGVPASGASGTRVVPVGARTALVIDAGSDPGISAQVKPQLPTPATGPAAVYVDQLSALFGRLGIEKVSALRVIHGHLDHVGGVPAVAEQWGVQAQNVVIPAEYSNLRAVQQAIGALRATTDASMVRRGFGAGWRPTPVKLKGAPGSDIVQTSFIMG